MKKAYIQPEVELLSLALLEDFLTGSSEPSDDDVTVNGGTSGSEGGNTGATEDWTGGNANVGTGGNQPSGDEWDDGDWT